MDINTLNGFEIFDDFMPGSVATKKEVTVEEPIVTPEGDDELVEELTDEELALLHGTDKEEESTEEPKKTSKNKKDTKEDVTVKHVEAEDIIEDDNEDDNSVNSFFEVLSEKMGWELNEDDEVPSTPEELVEYFQNVIEENSIPEYASEEVEQLDAFVKNGGNLRDYFQIDASVNFDEIDITEDENNQKLVVREFLKEKGFSNTQIDKKLTKYEDAGLLEDEAEDALEALREIKQTKKQQLLQEQENAAKAAKKHQQDYFNSVVNEIKGMDSIRGVKIPEKDKKTLLEYIFKADAEGQTGFQKDWSKSVKNLLESAYFTMKGDTLLKAAKNEGSSDAINRFKNSLNRTGVSRKTKKQESTSGDTLWNSFARQLRAN